MDKFLEACKDMGYLLVTRMSPVCTAAMWSDANLPSVTKQRIISSHVRSHCGGSLFASAASIIELRKKNKFAHRTYDSIKYKKESNVNGVVKVTERLVPFYVECPFENVFIELQKRFETGGKCDGYTLGKGNSQFIVVNGGRNHGNVAF